MKFLMTLTSYCRMARLKILWAKNIMRCFFTLEQLATRLRFPVNEMSLNDQPALENITLAESREASPAPTAIQVVHLHEQAAG